MSKQKLMLAALLSVTIPSNHESIIDFKYEIQKKI